MLESVAALPGERRPANIHSPSWCLVYLTPSTCSPISFFPHNITHASKPPHNITNSYEYVFRQFVFVLCLRADPSWAEQTKNILNNLFGDEEDELETLIREEREKEVAAAEEEAGAKELGAGHPCELDTDGHGTPYC